MNASDTPEDRTERHLRVLRELAEIGMDIARAVRAEALAVADAPDAGEPAAPSRFGRGDLGLVFSRVARAVRQTLALEAKLAGGLETSRFEQERRRVGAVRLAMQERQDDIRDFVARAVENEAEQRQLPDSDVEKLLEDLDERLEEGVYDDTLADGPIAELVRRICFDLGLTPDWRIWDDQDWAIQYLKDHTPDDIGAERWLSEYPAPAAARPEPTGPPPDPG